MSLTDTILIVDDSSFIVEGLVAILKKSYRPIAVYGGQQCLEALKKEIPTIIILDIMMEPMDGWETLSRIKENPATRHIPVLMFSAKKISSEEAEEHRISIDDFISKPVTPKKLLEAIEKVLARQKSQRVSIDSWRSAGIGQDRIDEYTSLMTSQEVDLSLLQNMKVQLSLIRDDDEKSRVDLEGVIAAIEGRIQEEHLQEEKLSREMEESVAKDAHEKEQAGPVMNESGQECLSIGSRRETASPLGISDNPEAEGITILSATEVPVPEVNVSSDVVEPEKRAGTESHPTQSSPLAEHAIPEITGPVSLFEGSARKELPVENPESTIRAESPEKKSERDPPLPESPIPEKIPGMNPDGQPMQPAPPTDHSVTDTRVSPVQIVPPSAQEKQPPVNKLRPLSARNIDNKPFSINSTITPSIGSGTDTSQKMSSTGRSSGSREAAKESTAVPVKDTAAPSGGFISRIISAIIGIFKHQGK
jgi:CheY-like chemotaxis protein